MWQKSENGPYDRVKACANNLRGRLAGGAIHHRHHVGDGAVAHKHYQTGGVRPITTGARARLVHRKLGHLAGLKEKVCQHPGGTWREAMRHNRYDPLAARMNATRHQRVDHSNARV